MALQLTCPACAAPFAVADTARYKKAFCPNCGTSLMITAAGVAQRNELPQPARTHPTQTRVWNPHWLFLVIPLSVFAGGCVVYFATRHHTDEQKQVAENGTPPLPETEGSPNEGTKPVPLAPVPLAPVPLAPINRPELISARPIRTLGPLAYGISPMAFSPDDKTLAAGGWSDAAMKAPWLPAIVDAKTGAAGHRSGEVRLWDVASSREIAARKIEARPRSLAFGPDASTLVIASDNDGDTYRQANFAFDPWFTQSRAVVWDFVGDKVVKTIADDTMGWAPRLNPDGTHMAFMPRGTFDYATNKISLWDIGAGKRTVSLQGHTGWPLFTTFSPDGKMLASSSYDGTVKLWTDVGKNTLTLKVAAPRLDMPTSFVVPPVYQPQDRYKFIAERRFPLVSTAFSRDNKILAAGLIEKERVVKLFDAVSGKSIATIDVLDGIPRDEPVLNTLAFSPDGKLLAVGINGESRLWDVARGKAVVTLSKDAVLNAVFSHDGRMLAVGTADGKVALWGIAQTSNEQNPK